MSNERINKMKAILTLAVAAVLAVSGIALCIQIVTLHDSYTGLPSWANTLIVLSLLTLAVTMTRSEGDDDTTNPA